MKTVTKLSSKSNLTGPMVIQMLKKLKEFQQSIEKTNLQINWSNVCFILICTWTMPNYLLQRFGMRENEPFNNNKENTKSQQKAVEEIENLLSDLKIKFLMIDATNLKKMYGPTFATLYEMASNL